MGKKKKPFYRIVVIESDRPRDGRFVEKIGLYDPLSKTDQYTVDEERVMYWLNNGAIPTETVRSILRKMGIIEKRKVFGGKPNPFEENSTTHKNTETPASSSS
jgi:small subunit ribosomal protein S16